MFDETPRRYPIRCRWCADSLMIDVPLDVKNQAGHVECARGHVTRYRYDGVTVLTEERRWNPGAALSRVLASGPPRARS